MNEFTPDYCLQLYKILLLILLYTLYAIGERSHGRPCLISKGISLGDHERVHNVSVVICLKTFQQICLNRRMLSLYSVRDFVGLKSELESQETEFELHVVILSSILNMCNQLGTKPS